MPVPQIVLDDIALAASSPTLNWSDSGTANSSFFNQTASVWNGTAEQGSLEWTFNGTQTAIYGTYSKGFSYHYTLLEKDDGLGFGNNTELEAQDKVNEPIVTQYALEHGVEHVARFTPLRGEFALDYVLYKPSDRAPLDGLTVLVDNYDFESEDDRNRIKFDSGAWEMRGLAAAELPPGRPVGESISETRAVGASFSYTFNGSSIGVYGTLHQAPGTLRVQYDVDGQSFSEGHFNGSQAGNDSSWRLNQVLFRRSLSPEEFPAPNPARPDEHTLTVRVEELSGNQSYLFDYLTYTATTNTEIRIPVYIPYVVDETMNPGPIVAGAVAVVLLWLFVFLGDKLPFIRSASRFSRRGAVPHGATEGYSHSQPAGASSVHDSKAPAPLGV